MKAQPEIISVELTENSKAILTIHVEEDGLGHIDPPTSRRPTLSEFDLITRQLSSRRYQIQTKPKT